VVEYLASTARTLCSHVVGSWFGFSANAAETEALASIAPEQDGFVCELAHDEGAGPYRPTPADSLRRKHRSIVASDASMDLFLGNFRNEGPSFTVQP
jgi:hypothetical protein